MCELSGGLHDTGRRSAEGVGSDHHYNGHGSVHVDLGGVDVEVQAVLGTVHARLGPLPAHLGAVEGLLGAGPAVLESLKWLGSLPTELVYGRTGVGYAAEDVGALLGYTLDEAAGGGADLAVYHRQVGRGSWSQACEEQDHQHREYDEGHGY